MSQNTGRAPARAMVPAVAKNVKGEVITSSPAPISRAISASSSASVPEETPMPGGPAIGGDLSLERAHVLAQDEVLTGAHLVDDRHHFRANLRKLSLKIE
jgi:hypothetical protein